MPIRRQYRQRRWGRNLIVTISLVALGSFTLCCAFLCALGAILPPVEPTPQVAQAQPTEPQPTSQPPTVQPSNTPIPPTPTDAPTAVPVTPSPLPPAPPRETEAAPTPTAEAATVSSTTTVNLRSGPSTGYAVVGSLTTDQAAPVRGRNADSSWWQLDDGAWVASSVVEFSGNADPLPIVEVDPPPEPLSEPTEPVFETIEPTPVPTQPTVVEPIVAPTAIPFQCIGGCAVAPDTSCDIKGNVNSRGEKIYHTRGSRYYSRTDIKPEEGDRWFCTTSEAEAAHFRAPEQ